MLTFTVILFDNFLHVYVFHSKKWLCTIRAWFCSSSLCNITAHNNLQNTIRQGVYPFNKTNFQDLSRTRTDFSRALKFTLMLLHYLDFNVNSLYCLPCTFFYKIIWFYQLGWQWELATVKRFKGWCFKHLVELTDFQNFPEPVAFFQNFPVLQNATI